MLGKKKRERDENKKHSKEIAKKLDKAKLSQARQTREGGEKNFACSAATTTARTITKIMKSDNYKKEQEQQQEVQQKRTRQRQQQMAARVAAGQAAKGLANIFQQLSK